MGCSTSIVVLFLFGCFTLGQCIEYKVYIMTGYYETSSRVEIRLVGDSGRTSAHVLSPRSGRFKSGSKNIFRIADGDVGKLNGVELHLQSGSKWSVRKVLVVVGDDVYSFIYHNDVEPGKWTSIGSQCPHGFQKGSNGACEDIDECQKNPCKGLAKCQNNIGSYACVCPRGYRVRYDEYCEDINECLDIKKPLCDQNCENTPGSYRCYCRSGYKFNEGKCLDINECASGSNKCDPSTSTCFNTEGSYRCVCKPGHYGKGDGRTCLKVKCSRPWMQGSSFGVISPSRCNTDNNYFGDVCTLSCKKGYELQDSKVNSLKCGADTLWKGAAPACKAVKCPPLSPLNNGQLLPSTCTTAGNTYQRQCNYYCNNGYDRNGSQWRECQANKTWTGTKPTCVKRVVKPTIRCPGNIYVDLAAGQNTSDVSSKWKDPTYTGDGVTLSVTPSYANAKYRYPVGATKVTWTVKNSAGSASCSIYVTVSDKEPPKVTYCPSGIIGKLTTSTSAKVTWTKPTFTDNVGVTKVTSTRKSGDVFGLGSWNVYYTASDAAGNRVDCKFVVIVKRKTCPLPPTGPFNGTKSCSTFGNTKFCTVLCPPGKRIFNNSLPTQFNVWKCVNGSWSPTPKIPDCVAATLNSNGSACAGLKVKMQISTVWNVSKYRTDIYCADCPTGTYSTNGKCIPCPAGQYQNEQGRSTCKPCPKGTSSNSGAADVKDCRGMCPPGQFSPDGMNPSCKLCLKGTYQDKQKSIECKKCPKGTSTISVAATKLSDCGTKPIISSLTAKPATLDEKKDTTISCYATGVPYPTLWLRFKKTIPAAFLGKMKVEYITGSSGERIGIKLIITGATFENTGQYECKASNSFGVVLKEVTLTVNKVFG